VIGSLIVERVLARELKGSAEIAADVGTSIHATPAVPPGQPTPALMFYMASTSSYDGPGFLEADDIAIETLVFHVVAVCRGTSHAPIRGAVQAQRSILAGHAFTIEDEGHTYTVTFNARGETPLQTRIEGDTFYRALGTVYEVEVTRS
jgi:hypothetical protein